MLDALGVDDEGLEHVEIRESIKPLLDRLDPREKRILLLRFFKNMTQSQIADEIGVSQMHVSRLLSRTLEQLRASLEDEREPVRTGDGGSALVVERLELAGWSTPARTISATTRQRDRDPGRVAAAEAPGHAELDQLGEHDRAAGPGLPPGQLPGAQHQQPRRTPGRTAPW